MSFLPAAVHMVQKAHAIFVNAYNSEKSIQGRKGIKHVTDKTAITLYYIQELDRLGKMSIEQIHETALDDLLSLLNIEQNQKLDPNVVQAVWFENKLAKAKTFNEISDSLDQIFSYAEKTKGSIEKNPALLYALQRTQQVLGDDPDNITDPRFASDLDAKEHVRNRLSEMPAFLGSKGYALQKNGSYVKEKDKTTDIDRKVLIEANLSLYDEKNVKLNKKAEINQTTQKAKMVKSKPNVSASANFGKFFFYNTQTGKIEPLVGSNKFSFFDEYANKGRINENNNGSYFPNALSLNPSKPNVPPPQVSISAPKLKL